MQNNYDSTGRDYVSITVATILQSISQVIASVAPELLVFVKGSRQKLNRKIYVTGS